MKSFLSTVHWVLSTEKMALKVGKENYREPELCKENVRFSGGTMGERGDCVPGNACASWLPHLLLAKHQPSESVSIRKSPA